MKTKRKRSIPSQNGASKPKVPQWEWKDEMYLQVYELAKGGLSNTAIASVLNCPPNKLADLISEKPALRLCLEKGRKLSSNHGGESWKEHLYGQLSDKLKKVWDSIEECDGDTDAASKLLSVHPLKVKQNLFLHAFYHCNFNLSSACRKVGISMQTPKMWANHDAGFAELVYGIVQCKKDFFENALVELVKDGNPHAIIFVNRTLNRDRGYNEKYEVDIKNTTTVKIQVDELNLPLDVRKQILDSMRKRIANNSQARLSSPVHQDVNGNILDTEPEMVNGEYREMESYANE